MLDKAKVKALRPQIDAALRAWAPITKDFTIDVGNASFDPRVGEVTFRVKFIEVGEEAEKARESHEAETWDMYEPPTDWKGDGHTTNPLHGAFGKTFRDSKGRTHKLVRHIRSGAIITDCDGREYKWKRDSVIFALNKFGLPL